MPIISSADQKDFMEVFVSCIPKQGRAGITGGKGKCCCFCCQLGCSKWCGQGLSTPEERNPGQCPGAGTPTERSLKDQE